MKSPAPCTSRHTIDAMDIKPPISMREKKLAFTTLALVSLSIGYIFILEPLSKKYVGLNQEIHTKQIRLAKSERLVKEKDVITRGYKKYSQLLTTSGSEEEEMAVVLSEIEKTGKAAGIYMSDVKPQRVKEMDFYRELLVEIKFQATMQTLAQFIYNLENSGSLLKVKRLQINIKGGGAASIEGNLQISRIFLL